MPQGTISNPEYDRIDDRYTYVEDFQAPTTPESVAIADNTGAVTVYSSGMFADYSPDSGASVVVGDAPNGVAVLTVGNTDNNEAYLHTCTELFKFAAAKPFKVKARVQFTETNTDDANVFFGVIDAAGAADVLVNNGAGMKTTASAAVFFKVDGGTNWKVMGSISTTQTIVELTAANTLPFTNLGAQTAGGSAYQILEIEWKPRTSALGDIVFKIDGNVVYVMRDFTYTNATDMHLAAGVKSGGTTGGEVLNVDYMAWTAKR